MSSRTAAATQPSGTFVELTATGGNAKGGVPPSQAGADPGVGLQLVCKPRNGAKRSDVAPPGCRARAARAARRYWRSLSADASARQPCMQRGALVMPPQGS